MPVAEKKERLERLQARIRRQAAAIARAMVGRTARVLVTGTAKRPAGMPGGGEGRAEGVTLAARTENNRVVNFAAPDTSLVGGFADVVIEEALSNSLRGRLASDGAADNAVGAIT